MDELEGIPAKAILVTGGDYGAQSGLWSWRERVLYHLSAKSGDASGYKPPSRPELNYACRSSCAVMAIQMRFSSSRL